MILALVLAILPPGAGFKFHIPDGWIDLSPGSPEDNFGRVPPSLADFARQGGYAAVAVDQRGSGAIMTATVERGRVRFTERNLPETVKGFERGANKLSNKTRVIASSLRTIQGVTVVRLVADYSGTKLRQLVYLMPGDQYNASLIFTTPGSDFDRSVAMFDRTAEKTVGIKEPWNDALLVFKIQLALAAALVIGFLVFRAATRKEKPRGG